MRVIYTRRANQSINTVLEYLSLHWSEDQVRQMFFEFEDILDNITTNRVKYPVFYKFIQYALIGKRNVKVFFQVRNDMITVIYFHSTKQNPKNLSFIKT